MYYLKEVMSDDYGTSILFYIWDEKYSINIQYVFNNI